MSGKMCSSSSSVIQAQKLVDQLRVEASMERFKVGKNLNHLLICFIEVRRLIKILIVSIPTLVSVLD